MPHAVDIDEEKDEANQADIASSEVYLIFH
jgi:hypothetical protein